MGQTPDQLLEEMCAMLPKLPWPWDLPVLGHLINPDGSRRRRALGTGSGPCTGR